MVADVSQESIAVPLKIEGVIVGLVSLGDDNELVGHTNSSTESYLKELLLSNMLESVSLVINYVGDPPTLGVPNPGELGHLRLM